MVVLFCSVPKHRHQMPTVRDGLSDQQERHAIAVTGTIEAAGWSKSVPGALVSVVESGKGGKATDWLEKRSSWGHWKSAKTVGPRPPTAPIYPEPLLHRG